MSFFSRKNSGWQKENRASRFRDRFFQSRVKEARNFHRPLGIMPSGKNFAFGKASWFWKLLVFVILLCAVLAIYAIRFSSYFLVREVTVQGTDQVRPEVISDWMQEAENSRRWGIIPQNSWLILDRKNIERIILSHSPRILKVTNSKRSWPNKIEVVLEDRRPDVIWQSSGEYYYLSSDGVIFEQVLPDYATSTILYIKLRDISERPAQIGENLGVAEALKFLEVIRAEWQNFIASPILDFKIPGRASPDLFLTATAGWTVYFDLKSDPLKQLTNLRGILSQEIPPDREKNLSYIDLRLPTIAYYCYRDEPCASLETSASAPPAE